jgi:hypothetical protein
MTVHNLENTCPECTRLLVKLEWLERLYTVAFDTMVERSGSTLGAEFIKLRMAADEARLDSEAAYLELQQHKRKHGKVLSRAAHF